MSNFGGWEPIAIILFLGIALFIILREVFLWYYKINLRVKIMEEQNHRNGLQVDLLMEIRDLLAENRKEQIEIVEENSN